MARKRSGFTLIELLTVISIIAILAAMLFPVYQQVKIAGKRAACLSNLKQLGTAVKLYADDCNRFPGEYPYVSSEVHFGAWMARIYKYLRNDRVYQCPGTVQYWPVDIPTPPFSGITRNYKVSYSYNEYLNWQYPDNPHYQFESESKLRNASSTAMLADGYQHALFHDWDDPGCWNGYEGCPSGMNRIRFADGPRMIGGTPHWEIPLVRHGGPNIVFCDLHVMNIPKDRFRAQDHPGADHDVNGNCTTKEFPIVYPNAQKF